MTHTPGPWTIDGTRIVDSTGTTVVDCREAMSGDDTQADKRLIAAAPDLVKALRDLVARADTTELHDGSSLDTGWAHAVLAHAEGNTV